jgi:hypothetical protein
MPFISPRSSSGSTFGRIRWKIRNISAVQRPMPRIATSSSMMASSSIAAQALTCTLPASKCTARSRRYSTLRADSPAPRIAVMSNASTSTGLTRPLPSSSAAKRSQTVCAAATEICWPTIERASVVKASPRLCRRPSPNCGMSLRITRSRRERWRQASSQ